MEIQELDNQIVYVKTRIVELSANLVSLMEVGSKLSESLSHKLTLLTVIKKALRDSRFRTITMTGPELKKMVQMSNELASNY